LSPAWRGRLAVENTWQDHTGQAAAEAPSLPAESREDETPAPPISAMEDLPPPRTPLPPRPASAINEYQSLQPPFAWLLAEPDVPESPAPKAPEPPRPAWDIAAVIADHSDYQALPPPAQEAPTDIHLIPLPVRWLPELRLRLLGYDDRGDPVITLRINTEGHGAYLTLSTHGQIPFDPGELDFLPSIGTALCQFLDVLYPYGAHKDQP
jgi:hypothetical protein